MTCPVPPTDPPECNCPSERDLWRGEVFGTKPPCPVHDTPARLAQLAGMIVERKPSEGDA